MYRAELKQMARAQIKGNIGILFLISLVISVVSFVAALVLGLIPLVGSVIFSLVFTPAFTLSTAIIYINLVKGQKPVVGDAFKGFYDLWSAIKVSFLTSLFTTLWTFLLIIPGIIKSFSYSMAMYILAENKGMSALEAIRQSKKMMHGKKMDLFILGLSFIGWE